MKIPYYREYDDYGYVISRLRPTGRCKIVDGGTGNTVVYVQHQGLIFRKWINVSDIEWQDHVETHNFTVKPFTQETLALGIRNAKQQTSAQRAAVDKDKDYDIV